MVSMNRWFTGCSIRRIVICSVVAAACLLQADVFRYLNTARIAYFNEKDYGRARKSCLDGIAMAPDNVELLSILGGSEMGLGNWGAAAKAFERAFTVDTAKTLEWIGGQPEGMKYYFQSFYFFSRELFEQAKYAEALNYLGYDAAFGIDDINVHVLRGATLYKMERFDEANNEYLKVLSIDPQNPDVNYLIAKSLFDNEDYNGCLSYFATAVRHYSARYERWGRIIFQNLLGIDTLLAQKIVRMWTNGETGQLNRLLADSLKFAEGLSVQAANIEQFSKTVDDLGRSYYCYGMAYYNLKNDTLALKNMLLSVVYKPDDIDGLYYAGEMNVKLGRYRDAIPHLERLTMLYPDDKYGWFYLGVCYTETKQYRNAVDAYENKILKMDPENIDVMNNLAYVYREMGDNERALQWLIRAEALQKKAKE
jgi:tetratricopeptide (TPR) repeat protein